MLYLGFRNFAGIYPTKSLAACMDVQHHLGGTLVVHSKKRLQHVHDELHGREIVIQQQHLPHWRRANASLDWLDDQAVRAVGLIASRRIVARAWRDRVQER